MKNFGRILFAIGLAGMGVLSVIYHGFALAWQPMPAPFPYREVLACLSGSILIAGGVGLLVPRTARWAALVLAGFLSSWLVLHLAFRIFPTPLILGVWISFAETVMLVSGGWILFVSQTSPTPGGTAERPGRVIDARLRRASQIAYGLAPLVISLSHFALPGGTAQMIPPWMPFRLGLAYFTGAAHVAAGIAILTGIVPRLAVALEATMLGVFVLFVHVRLVAIDPSSRLFWTMLFAATACSGASWLVASSFPRASSENAPARSWGVTP